MTASTDTKVMPADPTAWAHLPNAQHIDRVLTDVRARPQVWADCNAALGAAWDDAHAAAHAAAHGAAHGAARDAARAAAQDAARGVALGVAHGAARFAIWDAAHDAIVALVAWDDCAYILDMPPDACRVLATLGNHAAVLLYPTVIALNGGCDAQAT